MKQYTFQRKLEFQDFYDLAVYGNANWKGSFTQKEIAMNAFDYYCEYQRSMEQKKRTPVIESLLELLEADASAEAKVWSLWIQQDCPA